jgi:hypothetical protein
VPLDHPDREQLLRFLRDELDPEAQREVIRHLLRGCTRCVAATRSHWLAVAPAGMAGSVEDALAQARYRRRWGAAAAAGRLRRGERVEAAAQLAALYEMPPATRALRVALVPEMRSAALCRLLADDAGRLPAGEERRVMAELAVAVSERLDVERYGSARVAALRAYSGGRLAAALLATGELAGAEAALAAAEGSILGELGGSVEEAELLELRARVLCAREDFAQAEQAQAAAVVLYRARGSASRLGRALVRQGLVRARVEDGHAPEAPIAAIALVRAGLERLDEEADPRFAACARHWLGLLHAEAGEIDAGLAALTAARELYRLAGDPANLARTAYAAGRLEMQRGER